MKLKFILFTIILLPSIAFADAGFFSWLNGLNVLPKIKEKIINKVDDKKTEDKKVENIATGTPSLIDSIKYKLASSTSNVISAATKDLDKNDTDKFKSENESLKKSINLLQQRINDLNSQLSKSQLSCNQNIEKIKETTSAEYLQKLKDLEWEISGDINNNFRNKYDEYGQLSTEKALNIQFFRDTTTGGQFLKNLKEYDKMADTKLYDYAQKFITGSGREVEKFQEFYNYFWSVRKFPK